MFWILSAIAVAWALSYVRASLVIATSVAAAFLILYFLITQPSSLMIVSISLIFILITPPLNLPALRQRWISAPVFQIFKKIMPSVSQTEREVLEAGTVWWDGELFSGKPNWKKLLSLAPATLSDEEQTFLDGPVENLCHQIKHTLRDDSNRYPGSFLYYRRSPVQKAASSAAISNRTIVRPCKPTRMPII